MRGRALMMGLVALQEEKEINFFLHKQKPSWRKTMWGHREKSAIYKSGRGLSTGTQSDSSLLLDFPECRTLINFCYLSPPVSGFVRGAPLGKLIQPARLPLDFCGTWQPEHKWSRPWRPWSLSHFKVPVQHSRPPPRSPARAHMAGLTSPQLQTAPCRHCFSLKLERILHQLPFS